MDSMGLVPTVKIQIKMPPSLAMIGGAILLVWTLGVPLQSEASWPQPNQSRHNQRHVPGQGGLSEAPGVHWSQSLGGTGSTPRARLIDLDNDGEPEILLPGQGRIWAYGLDGTTFGRSPILGITDILHASDLNGDGQTDLLTSSVTPGSHLWVLDGESFALRWDLSATPPSGAFSDRELIVADVNDDAAIEILVSNDMPGTPDIHLVKPTPNFDGTSVIQDISGTDVQKVWILGEFQADEHQQVVFQRDNGLQLIDATSSATTDSIVESSFTDLFSDDFGGDHLLAADVDSNGTDEIVLSGESALLGQPIGIAVVSLAEPSGDWVQWGCQWSYTIDELASTAAIAQKAGVPVDLDGDGGLDFAIAYRDGCPTLLFDGNGTCPASPHVPVLSPAGECDEALKTGAFRLAVLDLRDGVEKATWDNASPLGPIDMDGDGTSELLVQNHDVDGSELGFQILRLEDGVLESVAILPVNWAPHRIQAFPRPSHSGDTEQLITRTSATGATEFLVHDGLYLYGWARFDGSNILAVEEPASNNPACGVLRATFPTSENPTHLLFDGNGTRVCVSDGAFNFDTEIVTIPLERSLPFLTSDMDKSSGGSDHPSDEIVINQTLFGWEETGTLENRGSFLGNARLIRSRNDGDDPELITMIGSTIRAYGPDGTISWSTGLPADHESFSFVDIRSGRFFDSDDPSGLFVLMEESTGPKRRRGAFLRTNPAPVFSSSLDLSREEGDIWSYSQYSILLPIDVGGADAIESILIRVKGGQTYLLSEADFSAPGLATPIPYGITIPGTIAVRTDLDLDPTPELLLSYEASGSGTSQKASYDVAPTGIEPHTLLPGDANPCVEELIDLGDAYARLCRWRNLVGENVFQHGPSARNYAVLDVDADGLDEFAFVDGKGDLHLLAGNTGEPFDGFPIRLEGGTLEVTPTSTSNLILSLVAVDISGDGATDLVATTGDGWLYALGFDATNAPDLLWSLYLGVPIHQVAPVDWDGDGALDLIASMMSGELLGLGSTALHVAILGPSPATEFIYPEISLEGTASGSDLVTVRMGGKMISQVPVSDGHWSAPITLVAGTSDIEVTVESGPQTAKTNIMLTYHPDLDLDGVENGEDCVDAEGHLDPTVYPGAPEQCDGRDNNCDGLLLPDGTPCDDADVCTNNDICSSEICLGTIILGLCDDENVCTTDSCDPLAGCVHVFNYLDCNDENACTTNDVCSLGICAGVDTSAVDCDDDNVCTTDTCDGTSGCVYHPSGLVCDDGNLATRDDSCNLLNICEGEPYECVPNACELSSTPNGVDCTPVYGPAGSLCDDNDPATKNDQCDGLGTCSGSPFECPPGPCIVSSTPNGSGCDTVYLPIGTDCDDGQLNTRDDGCNPLGDCIGIPYECTAGPCDASSVPNGEDCDIVMVEPGGACEDNDPNTKDDSCDADGVCAGTPYICEPATCEIESVADGIGCFPIYAMPGTSCDDGEFLTMNDICNGIGDCAGTPYSCTPNDCQISSTPNGNGCDIVPVEEGLSCDDGDLTSHTDQCDGEGNCLGISYECDPGQCEASSVANGVDCDVVIKAAGTSCVDDDPTTHTDTCDDAGVCSGVPFNCEPGPCVLSSTPNGVDCDVLYRSAGTPCDDGDPSTHTDVCSGTEACIGIPFDCPTSQCVPESTPNGIFCDEEFAPAGSACNDDLLDTKDDLCDGAGACVGTPYSCDVTDCQISSEVNGVDCAIVNKADGELCSDLNHCTTEDFCEQGQCSSGSAVVCDDLLDCTLDECDPDIGCKYEPDDTFCDDGVPCTEGACDVVEGCVQVANDSQCDDNNPCTVDRCDLQTGCQSDATPMNGTSCGSGQICADGLCIDPTGDTGGPDTSSETTDTMASDTATEDVISYQDGSFDSDDTAGVEDETKPGPGCGCSTATPTRTPVGSFLLMAFIFLVFLTRRIPGRS